MYVQTQVHGAHWGSGEVRWPPVLPNPPPLIPPLLHEVVEQHIDHACMLSPPHGTCVAGSCASSHRFGFNELYSP